MYGSLGTQLLQWIERGVNVNTHDVSLLRQKYATEKLKTVKAKAKLNQNYEVDQRPPSLEKPAMVSTSSGIQ